MPGPLDILAETSHGLAFEALRAILRPLVSNMVLIRAEGTENVPPSGPALLVCNHRSVLDPFVLAAILPRHVHFVAAAWMGAVPGLSAVLRSMGVLILPPAGRAADLAGQGREHLKAGALLCIFPEGARPTLGPPPRGQVAPFHRGAARIILGCGIPDLPVVPTALAPGRERIGLRLPGALLRRFDPADPLGERRFMDLMTYDTVTVRFGSPLAFVVEEDSGETHREQAEEAISSRLHDAVAELLRT